MKKVWLVVLVGVVMTVCLCGCGGGRGFVSPNADGERQSPVVGNGDLNLKEPQDEAPLIADEEAAAEMNDSGVKFNHGPSRNVDQAIAWARMQLGQRWPAYTCLQFVRTAYGFRSSVANVHVAIDRARAKRILRTGRPTDAPRGAWLMWRWSNFGHVGIRTDGSNLIHAITRSGTNYALVEEVNANLNYRGFTFAGWVNPGDLYNLLH